MSEVEVNISDKKFMGFNNFNLFVHIAVENLEMSSRKLEITKDEEIPMKIDKNWKTPHQKLFQCDLYAKQFDRPNELKWHRRTHSRCTRCNKSFKNLYTLKNHMSMHTGEKSFVCSVCGEKFSTNRGLRLHAPTHFDTRRYTCCFCPEKFKRLDILMDHVMRHNSVPETVRYAMHAHLGVHFLNISNTSEHWGPDSRSMRS